MRSLGPVHLIERAGRKFDLQTRAYRDDPSPGPPRVITISRQLGSGGRKIAEALAEQLGCQLWDKEILKVMVDQARLGHPARMFELVDERAQSAIDAFASSLVGDVSSPLYMHLLPKALRAIAQQDAVILGRGAHLVLPRSLKIRIVASMDTRIERLMEREGLTRKAALSRIRQSDQERDEFLDDFARQLRAKLLEDRWEAQYDLVLNTDHFSIADATRVIRMLVDLRFGKRGAEQPWAPAQRMIPAAQ